MYLDSLNFKTGGIGHLLTGTDKDLLVGSSLSNEQIESWFNADIDEAINTANRVMDNFIEHDDVRQRILVDLAFNLGYNKLSKFVNTLRFYHEKDYKSAANNLKQSLWYSQVKNRGIELCNALETGQFSFEGNK